MSKVLISLFIALLFFATFKFSIAEGNLRLIGGQKSHPQLPFHTLPLYGNSSMGYYYTQLYFGRPKQKQSLIVDTGSSILTSPCKKCEKCGNHLEEYYDNTKSYSSKIITCDDAQNYPKICKKSCKTGKLKITEKNCDFQISYGQGSTLNGFYLQDYVYLQNNTRGEGVLMNFGCTLSETKLFFQQKANGILGLAPNKGYAFEKLFMQHSSITNQKQIISICLAINGGVMTIGGSNSSIHTQQPLKIQINFDKKNNFYMIEGFETVMIDEKTIHDENSKAATKLPFFDSGSTITFFPFDEYIRTKDNMNELCSKHPQCKTTQGSRRLAFHLLSDELTDQPQTSIENLKQIVQKIFPPIIFTINGQKIEWKSSQYFGIHSLKKRNIVLGIDGLTYFLFGQNWLVNKDLVLDIKQKKAEIFLNSKCNRQGDNKNLMGYYKSSAKIKYSQSVVKSQKNESSKT